MSAAERRVREWSTKLRDALGERDHWIRVMHAEGGSLRAIASAAGMSHGAIQKIVGRSTDDLILTEAQAGRLRRASDGR